MGLGSKPIRRFISACGATKGDCFPMRLIDCKMERVSPATFELSELLSPSDFSFFSYANIAPVRKFYLKSNFKTIATFLTKLCMNIKKSEVILIR